MARRLLAHHRALVPALVAIVAWLGASRVASAQVTIELVGFGVGDSFRPGDWTGIRVAVTSNLAEPVQAELQWEVENADGDLVENVRSVALSPGQRTERWLYARLPPNSSASQLADQPFTIRVFETNERRRVREIGSTRISARTAATPAYGIEMDQDLLLVVGEKRLGLDAYSRRPTSLTYPPSLSSIAIVSTGVTPRDLPDRWEGLSSLSVMVWCDPTRSPGQLSAEQANAIREWVRRGGILVVGLSADQNLWGLGRAGASPLEELLPSIAPTRVDAVPVRELLPILSKSNELRDPTATTRISVFPPTLDRGYKPFLALPSPKSRGTEFLMPRPDSLDGKIVGVRRAYGFGHVVVLGIDLDDINGRMLQSDSLPQGDVFWNRVIARRGDTPSLEDYAKLAEAQRLVTASGSTSELGSGALVADQIGMTGTAALNVLAAVGLFGAYWAISGPLGFVALKRFKRIQLSWPLFVIMAFVFTAVAWAGGAMMGTTRPRLQHVTFLDQIAVDEADPAAIAVPAQRATSWFSVYLPGYGRPRLAIERESADEEGNLLASWSPPPSGTGERFPNQSRYSIPLDSQDAYRVPARSTTADFVARWMGTVDPDWGELVSIRQPVEMRIDRSERAPGERPPVQLVGVLSHRLPATLQQVGILVITPYRTPTPRWMPNSKLPVLAPGTSAEPPNYGYFFAKGSWAPNEALDLSTLQASTSQSPGKPDPLLRVPARGDASLDRSIRKRFYDPLIQSFAGFRNFETRLTRDSQRRYMEMLSLYSMLQPPPWEASPQTDPEVARAERMVGRELDLSAWFSRPCVIVMGFLEETQCPVPIQVEDSAPASNGLTVFRWICPIDLPKDYDLLVPELTAVGANADAPASDSDSDSDSHSDSAAPDAPTT